MPARSRHAPSLALRQARKRLSQLLSRVEWLQLLNCAGLLLPAQEQGVQIADGADIRVSDQMVLPLDGVTRDHASLIFAWSQTFVIDEIGKREKLLNMHYTDFLEAVVRLAALKVLPTAALMRQTASRSPCHFFERAKVGVLNPGSTRKEYYHIRRPAVNVSPAEYGEHVDLFCSFLLERAGVIDPITQAPLDD